MSPTSYIQTLTQEPQVILSLSVKATYGKNLAWALVILGHKNSQSELFSWCKTEMPCAQTPAANAVFQ